MTGEHSDQESRWVGGEGARAQLHVQVREALGLENIVQESIDTFLQMAFFCIGVLNSIISDLI